MQSNSIVRRKKVEQKMWRVSPSCLNVSHEVKKEASSTQVKKERKKKYIPFPFFPPDLISHRPPTSKPKTKDPKDQGKAGEKKRETSPVERDQNHQPLSQPSPTQRRTKNQRTGQRGVDISPLKPNQKPCFSAAAAAAAAAAAVNLFSPPHPPQANQNSIPPPIHPISHFSLDKGLLSCESVPWPRGIYLLQPQNKQINHHFAGRCSLLTHHFIL